MTELDSESTDDDGDYVEHVTSVTLVHEKIHQVSETNINLFATEIYAKLAVNDEPVKFQLDYRATINILPDKDAQCCDRRSTTKRAFVCGLWNGSKVTTRVIARNPRNHKRYSIECVVVHENLVPIIGAHAAQHMKLITINDDNFIAATPPNLKAAIKNSTYIIHCRACHVNVP